MARSPGRTTPCSEAVRHGRRAKAEQFLDAAVIIEAFADEADLSDALVTICVHAGVAAADVICCAALGKHAKGEDHNQAIGLLRTVDQAAAKHLDVLLSAKTRAGYSHQPVNAADRKRAVRAATALVQLAKTRT